MVSIKVVNCRRVTETVSFRVARGKGLYEMQ